MRLARTVPGSSPTTATARTPCLHEVVHGREVEPGRLDGDHRRVGLAGGRRGEQVVDVDAALEDDEVAAAAEQAERPGLPGRAGGEQQDDLHPRRTTVRLGAS